MGEVVWRQTLRLRWSDCKQRQFNRHVSVVTVGFKYIYKKVFRTGKVAFLQRPSFFYPSFHLKVSFEIEKSPISL